MKRKVPDRGTGQAGRGVLSRREFLGTVTVATAAMALPASGAQAPAKAPARISRTLKIGHITPRTGFIGQSGAYAAMGINLAVDEWNAKAKPGMVKFEVIAEDSVNPAVALQKATKLVEKDKVDFLFGEMSSASALAIMQVAQKFKKLYFNTGANSDELRQAKCNRYTFHTESSNSQMILPVGRYLVKNKKVSRWYFITPDYTYGYDCYNLANGILKKEGGVNLGQDLVPTGTTDFSSFILKIKSANPDLVFTSLAGNDMALFVKQFNEFGLTSKFFPLNFFGTPNFFLSSFFHRYCSHYYHRNADCTLIEDGLTNHDETFRYNGGWLPGGENPRCDNVIDHTDIFIKIGRAHV
jgi:branched-chain amino acid transport system substrate-binding protein